MLSLQETTYMINNSISDNKLFPAFIDYSIIRIDHILCGGGTM